MSSLTTSYSYHWALGNFSWSFVRISARLGELLASQLYYYIITNVIKSDDYRFQSFANNKAVGEYLRTKIFMPANKYYWNDMIEKATGEKLTAKYYARQFVK